MAVRLEPLWKPREPDATWHASWTVPVTPATHHLDPDFDGHSAHRAAAVAPVGVDVSQLPDDFSLAVVFGPSGSGKSSLLQELAGHFGLFKGAPEIVEFPADMAVCSHPGMNGESIDRLSCVGLNRVPSWLKPARVLSEGERQRVLCALGLQVGAILDDFGVVVDERNAISMAASLAKYVRSRNLRKVLVATTRRCVLPYLAPDFVLFAESGIVKENPYCPKDRMLSIRITPHISGYVTGKGGGWQGPIDEKPVTVSKDLGAGPGRSAITLIGGARPKILKVHVKVDDECHKAADAFDYEFSGETEQRIFEIDIGTLHKNASTNVWSLGAIVGPSGTGKSCNMRLLGASSTSEAPLTWDHRAIVDQLHSDKAVACALVQAVALPTSAALRPFFVLSTGEKSRAELARRLGSAADGECVCLDEFTSCLDRATARRVCKGVATFVRTQSRPTKVVVATVHDDILGWLLPDWVLESDTGKVTVFNGPTPTAATITAVHQKLEILPRSLSLSLGADDKEVKELLKPPARQFTLRRLVSCAASRAVYAAHFEQHHYLKGSSPTGLQGLILRDECGRAVAFHGISLMVGASFTNTTMRESRLVVLPDSQGFGLGPRLSNCVGSLLVAFGAQFYSRTAHPRLGSYRESHPELWHPTSTNGKALKSSMGSSLKKKATITTHVPLLPLSEPVGAVGEEVGSSAASMVETSCLGCLREQERAAGRPKRGRMPKHTCSLGEERVPNSSAVDADVRPRVCFSHRFVGAPYQEPMPMRTPQRKRSFSEHRGEQLCGERPSEAKIPKTAEEMKKDDGDVHAQPKFRAFS
eukprot:TRINITY_DN40011_c0_g1_i1.p1 TRINITY_DN40011_c0_g1~~TRINITY_DN40011_c0_g1_i1.p1  ORF type:complete len:864 (+),score=122.17 TRINITY_DN40011_c0_g1_i1:150-2594(+)